MKAQGEEGKEGFLESHFDSGQDCEDDGSKDFLVPECRIVVPPPSHVMCERALQLEKQRENALQWNSQSRRLVDRMLNDVYLLLQPTKEQQDARLSVIRFVDTFVKQRIDGSHIRAFGSYVMDLYTGSSDLDLSLNMGGLPVDRKKIEKTKILRNLTRLLHGLQNGRNGMTRHTVCKIEAIMRASVPVVKFVESSTNIECDVSLENRDGILKSELIGIFTLIDPRFRQLCFLLKAWARTYNVNESKKGTLNSLSIILLVAFHLQTRSPAILPSFSALLEGLVLQETEICIEAVKERVALHAQNSFGSDNKETLSQLFGSFFIKFVAVESLWEQGLCASVYEGKWISKAWDREHLGCMSVEDFAVRSQNCARAVREKEFDIIHQAFRDTLSLLNFSTASASQILEIKHTLFGVKSLKRTSEEPLVQSVGKQSKTSNGWINSAPYVGPVRADGFAAVDSYGTAHPHYTVYSNQNSAMTFTRPQVTASQGYQEYLGWAAQEERIRAAGRGIISLTPGRRVPYFAQPGHDYTMPRPFPLQIHHSPMEYPAYNAQPEVRALNYPGRGMAPNMVVPVLYSPYPQPQMYYPSPIIYRPDARIGQVARQRPNWSYNQLPQGGHASQTSVRRRRR